MAKSLEFTASVFSGRERHCAKCEFCPKDKLCGYAEICDAAFKRGFLKGYKYAKNKQKS